MSILDKFHEETTRVTLPYNFIGPALTMAVNQTDPEEIGNMAHQFGFKLIATVEVRFFANKAQHPQAVHNAEKLLLHTLYAEIRKPLMDAKAAIFAGDPHKALDALQAIETEIGL